MATVRRVRRAPGLRSAAILLLPLLILLPLPAGVAAASGPFTISGHVRNQSADPLPGIRVQFCTAPQTCSATTTRADGTYTSPPLAGASYRVRFTDPQTDYAAGYATTPTGNTTDRWSAALVVHLTADRAGIDGNMLPGTAIYGMVTGPTGQPLAGASISACGVPGEICGTDRTDTNGRYRVIVGEGRFTVRVRATAVGEPFDGYLGPFGLTFSRDRAVRLLGEPGRVHGASVQLTRAPRASLVAGSRLSSGGDNATISTRVAWAASADRGTSYTLRERVDLGTTRTVASVTGAAFPGSRRVPLTLGHGYRFDVYPTTTTGPRVLGALHTGPAFDLLGYQETSSQITYNGTWATIDKASRTGGHARASASTGATATFTFTGRSVGWVGRTGPAQGMAQVYVDGRFAGTFDLSTMKSAVRTLVFTRSWPTSGQHVVQISESGILNHAPVEVDGFVVMD